MFYQAFRTCASSITLALATLLSGPAAFGQAFLEPVKSADTNFLSSAATGSSSTAATPSTEGNIASAAPSYANYQKALNRFENEAAQLPANSALQDVSFATTGTLMGCPFTESTRAQIETIASTWINASIAAGAGSNSSQILTRDTQLQNLINQDQQQLGSSYSLMSAQDSLIKNQDLTLVNMNGGQDISTSQMNLMNQEENNLSKEIYSLAGN